MSNSISNVREKIFGSILVEWVSTEFKSDLGKKNSTIKKRWSAICTHSLT